MSRRRTSTFTVIKDVTSYVGGWALIVHQAAIVPPHDFNLWLLALGGTLVGVPGFSQLIAMRTGNGPWLSPSEESPPPSPLPSSSSSSESEAER